MLKDLLKANGLALEGDELPVEPMEQIDESIEAVETQGEEIEQAQSDIEITEEAVQTLESLVLAFESAAGERTALEKHLFVAHASTLYAQMGLAKPAQVSLESADGVTLSMEDFKETAKKVGDAIKAAWAKLTAMIKEFWVKLTDSAGRLKKKLESLKEKASKLGEVRLRVYAKGGDLDITSLVTKTKKHLETLTDRAKEYIDKGTRIIKTVKSLDSGDGVTGDQFVVETHGDYKEYFKTPFDDLFSGTVEESNTDFDAEKAVEVSIALMGVISEYHRAYDARQKETASIYSYWNENQNAFLTMRVKGSFPGSVSDTEHFRVCSRVLMDVFKEITTMFNAGKKTCSHAIRFASMVAHAVEVAKE